MLRTADSTCLLSRPGLLQDGTPGSLKLYRDPATPRQRLYLCRICSAYLLCVSALFQINQDSRDRRCLRDRQGPVSVDLPFVLHFHCHRACILPKTLGRDSRSRFSEKISSLCARDSLEERSFLYLCVSEIVCVFIAWPKILAQKSKPRQRRCAYCSNK